MRPQQSRSEETHAPRASLSERVYEEILGLMLSGRLSPGEVFNRRQKAAELGVGDVCWVAYDPAIHGVMEGDPAPGDRVLFWGVEKVAA